MRFALITCSVLALAQAAVASPVSDFNLIVFHDYQSGSNVWGRAAIGGNMSGNSVDVGTRLTPAANYYNTNVLLVGGNLQSNVNLQAGDSRYGGSRTGNVNLNGGGASFQHVIHDTAAAAIVAAMETDVRSMSTAYNSAAANSTSGVGNLSNRYTFTSGAASAGGTAYFNVTSSLFSSGQWSEFTFNNAANASLIVINVNAAATGGAVNFTAGNFDATSFAPLAGRIVWNFYNASGITVQRELFGTMIGADAHMQNTANINGSVAVGWLNQQGEVHGPLLVSTGVVPLPSASAMGAGALGLIAVLRRSRRS